MTHHWFYNHSTLLPCVDIVWSETNAINVCNGATNLNRNAIDVCNGATNLNRNAINVCNGATDPKRNAINVCNGATNLKTNAINVCNGATDLHKKKRSLTVSNDPKNLTVLLYNSNAVFLFTMVTAKK